MEVRKVVIMYNKVMKMIVGLGNPGRIYQATRHNIGYQVIDKFCDIQEITLNQKKFKGSYIKTKIRDVDVLVLKPLTFMNESGKAVKSLALYYGINIEDILVIYDDLDLPCGKLRLRERGNSGGHKGIKSIISELADKEFKRLRIGIDNDKSMVTPDYVLKKPTLEQKKLLKPTIIKAAKAADAFIDQDFNLVMNKFNKHE